MFDRKGNWGSQNRSGLPQGTQVPALFGVKKSIPLQGIRPPGPWQQSQAQLIEKHEGLFLMKPKPLLRPSPSSESHSRVSAQLHLKQDPFGAQQMPQTIHLGYAPQGLQMTSWFRLGPLEASPQPPCASVLGPGLERAHSAGDTTHPSTPWGKVPTPSFTQGGASTHGHSCQPDCPKAVTLS